MSEQNTQEPTMEEILASIRRIISEDDAPAETAEAAPPAPTDEPASPPQAHAAEPEPHIIEDDVLELTDRLDEPEPEPFDDLEIGDLDIAAAAPPPAPTPTPVAAPLAPPPLEEEALVSAPTASSAAFAFGALERSILMPAPGRTLEDVVRELLRPLLKDWLDENLPGIVEAKVQAEVERIARQRR